jgi:hypothetical protein
MFRPPRYATPQAGRPLLHASPQSTVGPPRCQGSRGAGGLAIQIIQGSGSLQFTNRIPNHYRNAAERRSETAALLSCRDGLTQHALAFIGVHATRGKRRTTSLPRRASFASHEPDGSARSNPEWRISLQGERSRQDRAPVSINSYFDRPAKWCPAAGVLANRFSVLYRRRVRYGPKCHLRSA